MSFSFWLLTLLLVTTPFFKLIDHNSRLFFRRRAVDGRPYFYRFRLSWLLAVNWMVVEIDTDSNFAVTAQRKRWLWRKLKQQPDGAFSLISSDAQLAALLQRENIGAAITKLLAIKSLSGVHADRLEWLPGKLRLKVRGNWFAFSREAELIQLRIARQLYLLDNMIQHQPLISEQQDDIIAKPDRWLMLYRQLQWLLPLTAIYSLLLYYFSPGHHLNKAAFDQNMLTTTVVILLFWLAWYIGFSPLRQALVKQLLLPGSIALYLSVVNVGWYFNLLLSGQESYQVEAVIRSKEIVPGSSKGSSPYCLLTVDDWRRSSDRLTFKLSTEFCASAWSDFYLTMQYHSGGLGYAWVNNFRVTDRWVKDSG